MNPRPQPIRLPPGRCCPRRRGGYVYLAVLFTTLVVVASVAAALSISTSSLRSENDRSRRIGALRLAEGELHRQAAIIRASGQWRTDAKNDVFSDWYSLTTDGTEMTGSPQARHRFTDRDGQLDDDDHDSAELTIHVKLGGSEAAITATLESDPIPFDLLRYSVTATDDIRIEPDKALSCENPVQVADDCTSGFLTTPRLECSGSVTVTLRGDLAASALSLPSRDTLNDYIAIGTEIPFASIPEQSGDLLIQDIVLSPTLNPYGATDPAGVYWFDARGKTVRICALPRGRDARHSRCLADRNQRRHQLELSDRSRCDSGQRFRDQADGHRDDS